MPPYSLTFFFRSKTTRCKKQNKHFLDKLIFHQTSCGTKSKNQSFSKIHRFRINVSYWRFQNPYRLLQFCLGEVGWQKGTATIIHADSEDEDMMQHIEVDPKEYLWGQGMHNEGGLR
jgi:hypothetical protein